MTSIQPRSLREIAESISFSIADVAYLSGLEESTISRLWDDPGWLDKVRGKTLQAIISVLPGVAELLTSHPLAVRRERILNEYGKLGMRVNQSAIKHLLALSTVPEQFTGTALETGLHILRGEDQDAARHLSRFWARDHEAYAKHQEFPDS